MRVCVYCRVGNTEQLDGMAMDAQRSRSTPAEKKRAWLYGRVALDDGVVLAAQMESLRRWATENGYVIAGETAEAGSGIQPDRPGLQEVAERVRTGQTDFVLIQNLSRLSRRYQDADAFLDLLHRHKVTLFSIDEGLELPPHQKLHIALPTSF